MTTSQPSKLGNIVSWIVGVLLIMIGMGLIIDPETKTIAGILAIIFALIITPPVKSIIVSKIPSLKPSLITLLGIVLSFGAVLFGVPQPTPEQIEARKAEQAQKEAQEAKEKAEKEAQEAEEKAKAEAEEKKAEEERLAAEKAKEEAEKATFDFDFDTYRSWVNDSFKSFGSDSKIPSNIKPEGDENVVNKTATIHFNDDFGAIISIDPKTEKVVGLMVMLSPSENRVQNIQNIAEATVVLGTTDGAGSSKAVNNQLIDMISKSMEKFSQNPEEPVTDEFVKNNVRYGVGVSKSIPVLLTASPAE